MVSPFFPPGRLDPVLEGGVGDEDPVVAPPVPAGGLVGQAVFGDQTDGPLLDAAGVPAVRQGQLGDVQRPRHEGDRAVGDQDLLFLQEVGLAAPLDMSADLEGAPARHTGLAARHEENRADARQ